MQERFVEEYLIDLDAKRAAEVSAAAGPEAFAYGKAPEYVSPYQAQIDEALNAYLNRPAFAWDPETDPQYAAYRKQYAREGARATEDTLGRYAAMTGGMPSSAAVTAAQQAGDYYAAQMADRIPELYQAAYRMYADEGSRLLSGLNALRGVESDAYARYKGRLGQYNADRDFDYGAYRDAVGDARALAKLAAQYGDYRGLQGLGVDVQSAKSAGSAGRTVPSAQQPASAPEEKEKPALSARVSDGYAAADAGNGAKRFSTRREAADWLKSQGVASQYAGRFMEEDEWRREKAQRPTSAESAYATYADYLNDYARYLYENYR